jgi:EmrB/QacA subfamily drug resistance transporter
MQPGREGTSPRLIALIVSCGMFMAQLDSTVVLVALPDMARAFSVRPVDISIGVTIYILAQAVLLPSSNWVADRFGGRTVFATALASFTIASILCGLSQSLPQFIAARVVQGLTAALMTPVARIVLLQATQKEDLISVMTITTVPMLVAPTIGPPIGGLITTYLSWRWIFFLNVPLGILGTLLVLRFIPHREERAPRPFDVVGFVLMGAAVAAVLSGLDQVSASGSDWRFGSMIAVAGVVLACMAIRHLRRHEHPLLSLETARIKTYFATTIGGGALIRLPARAVSFILPLLFQIEFGYSPVQAGFFLLAMNGGDLLLKVATTRTLRRFGFRNVILLAALAMLLAIAACAAFSARTPYWGIVAVLAVAGMARSLLFTAMSTLAFVDVPSPLVGSASVVWNVAQQVTNALGVTLAAIVLNVAATQAGDIAGHISLHNCRIALLVMAAIGALSILSFLRLPPNAGAAVSGHGKVESQHDAP